VVCSVFPSGVSRARGARGSSPDGRPTLLAVAPGLTLLLALRRLLAPPLRLALGLREAVAGLLVCAGHLAVFDDDLALSPP
jgi:hypothetical protein